MVDSLRPISELSASGGQDGPAAQDAPAPQEPPAPQAERKLWVKLPDAGDPRLKRIQLILSMFPGQQQMIVYCAAEKKRMGCRCLIHEALVEELRELLGEENVVVK